MLTITRSKLRHQVGPESEAGGDLQVSGPARPARLGPAHLSGRPIGQWAARSGPVAEPRWADAARLRHFIIKETNGRNSRSAREYAGLCCHPSPPLCRTQHRNDGALPEREGPLRDHPALTQDRESSIKVGDRLFEGPCRPGRALISRAAAAKTPIAPSGAR